MLSFEFNASFWKIVGFIALAFFCIGFFLGIVKQYWPMLKFIAGFM
jgi:hypothetical protein